MDRGTDSITWLVQRAMRVRFKAWRGGEANQLFSAFLPCKNDWVLKSRIVNIYVLVKDIMESAESIGIEVSRNQDANKAKTRKTSGFKPSWKQWE
jgi:hypothetical protein